MTIISDYEEKKEPDKILAKRIIHDVGSTGQPPVYGYQYFTAGIDRYINTIDEEYLCDYISCGGSSFKLVIGTYGGGKTHFLYSVQGRGWLNNYVTSYVELSADSTPFHKLETVYRSIAENLIYPQKYEDLHSGYERGIESLIKYWYSRKRNKLEESGLDEDEIRDSLIYYISKIGPYASTSFQNALKHSFLALADDDYEKFSLIIQYLKGENLSKTVLKEYQIFEKIDRPNAFKMIRSLISWIKEIEFKGLIVLMDEAEQTPSMTTKQRETLLNNLRELIDACSKGTIGGSMIFYAVPDENFLEGRTAVYEALNQRLQTVFDGEINPSGVKIDLERSELEPEELLTEIGIKLSKIYETAYGVTFDDKTIKQIMADTAKAAYEERFGEIGYKREFVQRAIKELNALKVQVQR
ncbi:BREX system ATP-binding domain-containing protein [Methanoplanus endosymbiosus]|uniref:DUF2791 family P-loop domain-containing protein n=1 Tax=Methanoplanus endosymbiosus TaxID=33865 RepID=A0A9E7THC9_9EURY|nr:BREX system ATP-binding domain-containing protein [Methanoplanus endosymbiosus]UUX92637.1 DUF2791 family P-loop domain-containing protein [Methanoplanus endosymbiosus]